MHSKKLHLVAFVLVVVGGLNWLLIGVLNMNLVTALFGSVPLLERAVYTLVGLSAVYELITHRGRCKHCNGGQASSMTMPPSNPGMMQ